MKKISMFTGVGSLSAVYLVATVSHVGQLQGDFLGTLLWTLAIIPGSRWLTAQIQGAIHKARRGH